MLAYYWGITGVVLLLSSAVWRLAQRVVELQQYELGIAQWLVLLGFAGFMLYSEGYRGFHQNFAPRVVARAASLRQAHAVWLTLLAPLVCMGYLHATRKRQLISLLVTAAIVVLVLVVSRLAQPWRGIIDAGVVLGLAVGILSVLWHWLREDLQGKPPAIAPDLPESA